MSRRFRPALLVTIAACAGTTSLACGFLGTEAEDDDIHMNPPPDPPEPQPLTELPPEPVADAVTPVFPSGPVTAGQNLNPRDAKRGEILRGYAEGSCYVYGAFKEAPKSVQEPPHEAVICPEAMLTDPAWAACLGGNIAVKDIAPLSCVCYHNGNPPPSPEVVACPAEAVARAG